MPQVEELHQLALEQEGEIVRRVEQAVREDGREQIASSFVEKNQHQRQEGERKEGGGVGMGQGEEQRGAPQREARPAAALRGSRARQGTCRRWPTKRANISAGPPAANGTMIFTGLTGHDCAYT